MLAEIFVLRLEAERRAREIAADVRAPRFVPFKSETWQGSTTAAGRIQRLAAQTAGAIAG
jgi:hypothetical protein